MKNHLISIIRGFVWDIEFVEFVWDIEFVWDCSGIDYVNYNVRTVSRGYSAIGRAFALQAKG